MIHFARALIRTAALLPCLSVAAIAQAEEEKILNVYNWPEYIGESTVRSFEKETGIEALAPDGLVEAFSVADARGFNLCLQ